MFFSFAPCSRAVDNSIYRYTISKKLRAHRQNARLWGVFHPVATNLFATSIQQRKCESVHTSNANGRYDLTRIWLGMAKYWWIEAMRVLKWVYSKTLRPLSIPMSYGKRCQVHLMYTECNVVYLTVSWHIAFGELSKFYVINLNELAGGLDSWR